jgi:hypothetical protein
VAPTRAPQLNFAQIEAFCALIWRNAGETQIGEIFERTLGFRLDQALQAEKSYILLISSPPWQETGRAMCIFY